MLLHKNRKISLVKQQYYASRNLLTSLGEKCGLTKKMELYVIYPKPGINKRGEGHKKYHS
ncbi:MAG: hypothetical protein AYP45_05645 [Candidatus Brocadia carolinensis]|uniref:Uncharacterized protein n=1 Tax=Candidatus Brocadia carolinensis TaxID=1004156 RepID=A0A1V4AVB3_9BACT|nr:MAG: hypothetical protein AYP45_05645 [Candidatus Brocadia caroliniensis]